MTAPLPPSAPWLPGDLLAALEATGPLPALVWHGEDGRTELSGRVLANWVVKATNHLSDEVALTADDALVLDLPAHWKRLVLALAGWSLGAHVAIASRRASGPGSDGPVAVTGQTVVATDDGDGEPAAEADEVLVLEPVALSLRAPGGLPALAHDWAQEVRGAGDALGVAVGPWSGPVPRATTSAGTSSPGAGDAALLVEGDGADEGADAALMIGAWLRGARVVGPAGSVDEASRRAEGAGPSAARE